MAAAKPLHGSGAEGRPRILIVEDEALVAMSMETALTAAGYAVLQTVDTEADAVSSCQRLRPDIVIMDITLREGSGLAAARTIRAVSQEQIIVFVSGTSDLQTQQESRGISPIFIHKPFRADRFAALIANAASSGDRWKSASP